MTILSQSKAPVGIKALSVSLVGLGGLYLTMFVGYAGAALGQNASLYGITESNLSEYLVIDVVNYLLPAASALYASYLLFLQKKHARLFVILYGCSSLPAFQFILNGHPFFLFGLAAAAILYYVWQPHVKDYFQNI